MLKKFLAYFGILIVIFSALFIMMSLIYNGSISEKHFPLQAQWVTDLNGGVETLSTNGDQIIFARTKEKPYALDVQSGKILWNHDLIWQGVPQPPIALNGTVYLADGKTIWALDQVNGSVKWKNEVPLSSASVEFVSEKVVVVEIASTIYVLDAIDGKTLWSKADCRYGKIQAYVESSRLFSPCIDGITAMNESTGEIEWVITEPFSVAKVAYQNNIMYYLPDRNTISALNLKNRNVLWKSGFTERGYIRFKVLGNYLSVSGSDRFFIFQRETGNQEWCTEFNNPQNPTLFGNMLFVFNGYQNNITAFEIATGNKIGELSINNLKVYITQKELMVTTDRILVFGNGSRLFAFGE